MKAITLVPGTTQVRVADRPEPGITTPDEVKLRVLRVGICGTDREEAAGGRAQAPPGASDLVIGHEMLGRVVDAGSEVRSVQPGDLAVFTVRRGCQHCRPCLIDRSDMCESGEYSDRGIRGLDGYQTEFVVDREHYLVKIPGDVGEVGVLAEPMSIAQKAIDEALIVQTNRLPEAGDSRAWLEGKRALIAGLGPIGLLACVALRLRGARVLGLDVVDDDTIRPTLLTQFGGEYVDGRRVAAEALGEHVGQIDLVLEATGVAHVEFDLLEALGKNGVYVLTGIPGGDRPINIDGAALVRKLVLGNQVMMGSVNASRKHFEAGVHDLQRARQQWGSALGRIITHLRPFSDFATALAAPPVDEIKAVLEWHGLDD